MSRACAHCTLVCLYTNSMYSLSIFAVGSLSFLLCFRCVLHKLTHINVLRWQRKWAIHCIWFCSISSIYEFISFSVVIFAVVSEYLKCTNCSDISNTDWRLWHIPKRYYYTWDPYTIDSTWLLCGVNNEKFTKKSEKQKTNCGKKKEWMSWVAAHKRDIDATINIFIFPFHSWTFQSNVMKAFESHFVYYSQTCDYWREKKEQNWNHLDMIKVFWAELSWAELNIGF